MNAVKRINFLALSWAIEAMNQDAEDVAEPKIDFAVGGQAVIEGVMMRSPNSITIAVRKPSGEIKVKKKEYQTLTQKYSWLNVPILRGVVNLFEMMIIGTDAINFSANESLDEPVDPKKKKKIKTKFQKKLIKFAESAMFALSFVFAMGLSLSLFKFLPYWITTFLEKNFEMIANNYILFNFIDGVIKMSIFLTYIFLLSLIPDFRRIFEYHGAEHKSIWAYETKGGLTVDNAAKQTRYHPRCGTSFILIVFVISIIFYNFIPKLDTFWSSFGLRVAVLPFIAGISYEYLKLSAKHQGNIFVKSLIAPGLWFQRLTTKEPDKKQLEIGLKSLTEALTMEKAVV